MGWRAEKGLALHQSAAIGLKTNIGRGPTHHGGRTFVPVGEGKGGGSCIPGGKRQGQGAMGAAYRLGEGKGGGS